MNVVDPSPGEWRVQVESKAGHSLSGTGITPLKFHFGFTQDPNLKVNQHLFSYIYILIYLF